MIINFSYGLIGLFSGLIGQIGLIGGLIGGLIRVLISGLIGSLIGVIGALIGVIGGLIGLFFIFIYIYIYIYIYPIKKKNFYTPWYVHTEYFICIIKITPGPTSVLKEVQDSI